MHLLIVSHAYGGEERVEALSHLAGQDHVTLVAPMSVDTQVFGRFDAPPDAPGVTVRAARTVPFVGGHFLFRPASWRGLRRHRPAILQVEYDPWTPEFWSALLPLRVLFPRVPLVVLSKKNTRHVPEGIAGIVERALTWLGRRRIDAVIAVSHRVREIFERLGVPTGRITVQPHLAVDGERFHPAHGGVPARGGVLRVGFVGQLGDHKGMPDLLAAATQVRAEGIRLELHVLGPERNAGTIAALTAHEWVTHHEPTSNAGVADFLRTLDVFVLAARVLPDHEEHDGHALLEAMATGLACVGSSSGIIPELLEHERTGLVFPAGDVDALATCLRQVLLDPASRARMGAAARQSALAYAGLDAVTSSRRQVYASLTRR